MFALTNSKTSTEEHVSYLLEEIYSVLADVKKHQMEVSMKQCTTIETVLSVLQKMVKKQGKLLEEIRVSGNMRQLQYEALLNILAEQQRQTIDLLEKHTNDFFVNVNNT